MHYSFNTITNISLQNNSLYFANTYSPENFSSYLFYTIVHAKRELQCNPGYKLACRYNPNKPKLCIEDLDLKPLKRTIRFEIGCSSSRKKSQLLT